MQAVGVGDEMRVDVQVRLNPRKKQAGRQAGEQTSRRLEDEIGESGMARRKLLWYTCVKVVQSDRGSDVEKMRRKKRESCTSLPPKSEMLILSDHVTGQSHQPPPSPLSLTNEQVPGSGYPPSIIIISRQDMHQSVVTSCTRELHADYIFPRQQPGVCPPAQVPT